MMNNASAISHHPSIDWQLSIKLANNNQALAKELLEMFVADLPRASGSIHAAVTGKEDLEIVNQVHRLHGAACYCGVSKLKEILERLEFTAREKLGLEFTQTLSGFDDEVNNVLSAYKQLDFE
jgi:two-component system, NarL family, sensor histidine kinase BarA